MKSDKIGRKIGFRIRLARENAGLTQTQLAEIMNVSKGYISHCETGKTGYSKNTLIKFAKSLKVELDYFYKKEDTSVEEKIKNNNSIDKEELSKAATYMADILDKESNKATWKIVWEIFKERVKRNSDQDRIIELLMELPYQIKKEIFEWLLEGEKER